MPISHNALICAVIATLFWGAIGLSAARWLRLPQGLVAPVAPALGWAIHGVICLPLFCLIGLTGLTVSVAFAVSAAAAGFLLWKRPTQPVDHQPIVRLPVWAFAGAATLASAIMLAILPKISDAGAALSMPVFDHAKVAMIDTITRLGVPAINPFFGETGGFQRLAYYYLWHFTAAELTVLTGFSGWEADAGMTGFTALSSLLLMMGFAVWLSAKASSAGWALLIAATTSIRPPVTDVFGAHATSTVIGDPSGFGTWLFQIFWAPQHVASANSVLIAIFLLVQLARQQRLSLAIILGLLAAAAFQSSTWVGGVTLPLAAAAITALLLVRARPDQRLTFAAYVALAGVVAAVLAAPFLIDQFKASTLRAENFPIAFLPFEVLGDHVPTWIRRLLDVPAYWTMFLFVEFAACYPAGFFAAEWLSKDCELTGHRRSMSVMLALLAVVSLAIGGLLRSTTAVNNDLSWRGVLPALLVLAILTGAGLGRYLRSTRTFAVALLMIPIGLALVDGIRNIRGNLFIEPSPSAERFLKSPALWAAVRSHAGEEDRIANNPHFLADATYWPINISWALNANRNSCYAGSDLALPFAPLSRERRAEIDLLFTRIFAGETKPDDLEQIATRYNCAVVVLTPEDAAWMHDPFAASSVYRMVDSKPDWRIYRIK